MRGITHTDRTDKVNVNFTWTAPDEGTGTVEVRFAVVRMRVTYWANQLAATLQGMCRHRVGHILDTHAIRPLLRTPSARWCSLNMSVNTDGHSRMGMWLHRLWQSMYGPQAIRLTCPWPRSSTATPSSQHGASSRVGTFSDTPTP